MARRSARWGALTVLVAVSLVSSANAQGPGVGEYVDEALAGLDGGLYAATSEWEAAKQAARSRLYESETVRDTHLALGALTRIAGGRHSHFASPETVSGWARPYPPGGAPAPNVVFEGSVAILTVPGFASSDPDEIANYLRAAADAFDDARARETCGWIVDLSGNGGGNMALMMLTVSPLLDDGLVQVFERRDGTTQRVWVHGRLVTWEGRDWGSLPPPGVPIADLKHAGGPIAVVQSGGTASGGEAVLLAFAGQAGVRSFGTDTAGFTTVNDGFRLPDGAEVTLTYARMGDRAGNFRDGPVAPDIEVSGAGPARETALEWVRMQCRADTAQPG